MGPASCHRSHGIPWAHGSHGTHSSHGIPWARGDRCHIEGRTTDLEDILVATEVIEGVPVETMLADIGWLARWRYNRRGCVIVYRWAMCVGSAIDVRHGLHHFGGDWYYHWICPLLLIGDDFVFPVEMVATSRVVLCVVRRYPSNEICADWYRWHFDSCIYHESVGHKPVHSSVNPNLSNNIVCSYGCGVAAMWMNRMVCHGERRRCHDDRGRRRHKRGAVAVAVMWVVPVDHFKPIVASEFLSVMSTALIL